MAINDVGILLDEIEYHLQHLGLWNYDADDYQNLLSDVPFAADVMDLYAWLQFRCLPQFRYLLANNLELPKQSDIVSYADYVNAPVSLIKLLAKLDELLNNS